MRQRINKKITVFVMMLALISGTIYFDFGNTVYANAAAEDESATIEATSEEAVEADTEEQQADELTDIDIVEDELLLGSGIQGGSVSYLAYNEASKSFSEMSKEDGEYTVVTNQTSWGTANNETWYVVYAGGETEAERTITINSRITVAGTVNLILCDGCTLNATKGITVTGTDNTLKIYAQSNGNDMGKLNATATDDGCSGIGGINQNLATGNIVINGGEIAAQGRGKASGIGSGNVSTDNDGTITINGGIVTATGGSGASGIGRSSGTTKNGYSDNINIIINGGIITARGGEYGSGIGSGRSCSGSINIRIYEGVNKIDATNGGGSAECIGKGDRISATVNLEFYNSAGNKVTGDDKDALFSDETSGSTRTITTIIHHEHSWSYAANGNTITATCSNQDGGHKGDISSSISVSAEGKTYDGTPVTATVTGSIPGIDAPTVIYKEGSTTLAGAPSKAGIYTANITIGGVTASASYVISKAPLTITANPKDITYGDEPEGAGVIYNGFINEEDESVLGGRLDYDFDYERYGDIGSYNITPKGISGDNYNITFAPGTLTVFKKEIGITWSNTSILYNGSAQKPTASATGLVNDDSCDIEVSGGQTECGTGYTATAISLSNNNYKLPSDASLSTTYEIVKADIEQGVTAVTDLTYNGDEQALVTTDNTAGTVYYRLGTEGDFQTTIPKATNAGNYTVYWYISGGNNYNDVASSSTPRSTDVSIAKRSITVSGISSNDKEYDGNTDAELLFDNVVYGGIVSGDNLSVNANGSFADAKPGADKNVIISGLTLGGDDIANYVLAANGQQKSTTADILIDTGVVTETTENADGSSMTIETYYEDGEISGMTVTGVSADHKSETVTSLDKDGNVLSVAEGEINADGTAAKYVDMIAGAPKTTIDNDIDALADELLTDEEKEDVQAGDIAKFYLVVEDVTADDSFEKDNIMAALENDEKAGLYLDLNLFKVVGNAAETQITDSDTLIDICIKLPTELINTDDKVERSYHVIRLHNGEADIIEASYNKEDGTLSFNSDKFSIYAVSYIDNVVPANEVTPVNEAAPLNVITPTNDVAAKKDVAPTNEVIPINDVTPANEVTSTNEVIPTNEVTPANEVTPTNKVPTNNITPANEVTPAQVETPSAKADEQNAVDTTSNKENVKDTGDRMPIAVIAMLMLDSVMGAIYLSLRRHV